MSDRTLSPPAASILTTGRRAPALALALALTASCSLADTSVQKATSTVSLALQTSGRLEMSRLAYQDACGSGQAYALGPALADAFAGTAAQTFTLTQGADGVTGPAADRLVTVDLDVGELVLFVAKDVAGSYPASVALSVSLAAYDAQGRLLEEQELHADVSGTVEVAAGRCAIRGLERLAGEAVATLAEDFGRYLRSSRAVATGTPAPDVAPGMAQALAFRARLTDQNGDRILESEEAVTLEMEVTNLSRTVVRGVHAVVAGSLELVPPLPPRILLGDLQPGESRRHQVTARLVPVAHAGQLELIVSVGAPSAAVRSSTKKKFLVTVRPKRTARLSSPNRGETVVARPGPDQTEPGPNRIDSVKAS